MDTDIVSLCGVQTAESVGFAKLMINSNFQIKAKQKVTKPKKTLENNAKMPVLSL